jgi:hypothetical protein
MAFAVGLLQPSALNDFEIIRKVRNYFAHETETAEFDAAPVSDWCRGFAQVNWPGQPNSGKPRKPREWFLLATAGLSAWADWTLDQISSGARPACTSPSETERFGI